MREQETRGAAGEGEREGERGGAAHYGAELARLHHEHFGMVARAAARELLGRLTRAGTAGGLVVDLAAGSGILGRAALEAGFEVLGVDISRHMIDLARVEAPGARLAIGSLWTAELPRCAAIAAVGEAFSYAADPSASLGALERRLGDARRALAPGGLLLFDVAGPGRSGPGGARRAFWTCEDAAIGVEEQEDAAAGTLTRTISVFVPQGALHRRVVERHTLRLYAPDQIEAALDRAGFGWERLAGYHDLPLGSGWHAYAARPR